MHFPTFASLALCLATVSTAAPAPIPQEPTSASAANGAPMPATNTTMNCAAATILAIGIAQNIVDQRNEQAALAQVKTVLQKQPVDMTAFQAAKSNLLVFVNDGITIRQSNQAIAPVGNPATAGLQTVSMAQLAELSLAQGLTGNPAVDLMAVATMETDFSGGIVQNMKNQAAATAGCPAAAAAAPTGAAGAAMAMGMGAAR